MRDIITTFTRLTDSESTESKVFNNVLSSHYDKFKYFYITLSDVDRYDLIKNISCDEVDGGLNFIITFKNIEDLMKYKELVTDELNNGNNDYYIKYFSYLVYSDDNQITIRVSCNLENERNIYAEHYKSI